MSCFKALGAVIVSSLIGIGSAPAQQPPEWMIPDLLDAARAEGQLTVYSSTNEQEGLPLFQLFQQATGIKVNYVRGADAQLMGKIAIEARSGLQSWDILHTPTTNQLPETLTLAFDPPLAQKIVPAARDPKRHWYGVYSNYNAPAFNTKLVKREDLPKTYEGFLQKSDWVGHVAIEGTDNEWMNAMFAFYGEARARKLIGDIVDSLKVAVLDGHLAVARAVAAGEYWVALNNYVVLTNNMAISGAPTDFWAMDPVAVLFGQVAINAKAPHGKAALLAANFLLSREAQAFAARTGRIPTRPDLPPVPADVVTRLEAAKVLPYSLSADQIRASQRTFDDLFHKH